MKVPGSLFKVYSWPCIEYSNGLVIKKLLHILAKGTPEDVSELRAHSIWNNIRMRSIISYYILGPRMTRNPRDIKDSALRSRNHPSILLSCMILNSDFSSLLRFWPKAPGPSHHGNPRRLKLRRGDLLIAGTDGLFDNIGERPGVVYHNVVWSLGHLLRNQVNITSKPSLLTWFWDM